MWLATSEDLPGLVVEAPTRAEVIEAAHNVAQKLIESYCEHGDPLPREFVSRAVDTLSEVEIAVAL
jgi:predicted RNase H-like HicB family nuclease